MNKEVIIQKEKAFIPEQIKNFLTQNSYRLPGDFRAFGQNIGCIDDRADEATSADKIAIPGAGLGVLLAVLESVKFIEVKYNIVVNLDKIASEVQSVTGVSFHSDEKNSANEHALACAGCGHCAGILNNPSFGENFSSFIKDNYLPKLLEQGEKPMIYKGEHNANAVVVINDLETGLRSKSSTSQVYVYNQAWHRKILEEVAKKIFHNELVSLAPDLTEAEVIHSLREVANEQLTKTVQHLAAGLPVYDEKGELVS